MILKFINDKILKKIKTKKVDKKGLSKTGKLSLTLASIMLVSTLSGCGGNEADLEPNVEQTPSITTESGVEEDKSQDELIQELMDRIEQLENNQNPEINIGEDDTYSQEEWNKFINEAEISLRGKINNNNKGNLAIATSLWNINHLDEQGKKVLLDLYADGQDIEYILNKEYSLASQIREYNTEIEDAEDYYNLTNLILNSEDSLIIAAMEDYYKEAFSLKSDLTDKNKNRIQDIFDMFLKFSNGTGTIPVLIDGKVQNIAQIQLTDGGIFAAEIIAQQLSVISKDIVSQDLREDLDSQLRNKDNLANVQNYLVKYTTIASLNGIDAEKQTEVVKNYEIALGMLEDQFKVADVTKEETKALYTVHNIEFLMSSSESQHAFEVIYEDGININELFKSAEEAIRKIELYNSKQDSSENMIDLAYLSIENEADAVSLRALALTTYNVESKDSNVSTNAVNTIKGYHQYSSDVRVEYTPLDEEGNKLDQVSLDKNALSLGAKFVANAYTYSAIERNKKPYGQYADPITAYVDGSALGLDPYEQIVLMVENYCVENNIVLYNYQIGK